MYLILSFNKKYKQQNYLGFSLLKTRLYSGTLIFHCELSKIRKKIFQFVQRFSNCYCEKGECQFYLFWIMYPNT